MKGYFFLFFGVISFAILLGCIFFIQSAKAENGLILETIKKCNIQHAGSSCVSELKLANNTDYVLDATAFLHIDYQGLCSNDKLRNFDGEGITAQFFDNNWLNFSDNWDSGTTKVSGFKITKGKTQPKLEIETIPNLCPGEYTFTLELKGVAEKKEYAAPLVMIGGGGGYYTPPVTPTTNTGEVIATPGEGGITTLTNPDGSQIKLIIPRGAVSRNTNFTIEKVDISLITPPSPKSGLFFVDGLVYRIEAKAGGKFVTIFNKPLTLTFSYTNKQIEELNEASLKIGYWSKTQNQWKSLGSSKVDINNNTVTASTDHFTIFVLIGPKTGLIEKGIRKEIPKETEGKRVPKTVKEVLNNITEGIKKVTSLTSSSEVKKPLVPGEASSPGGTTAPSKKISQRGLASRLTAAIGMAWGKISKSTFLTIIVILCLMGLALVGIRGWRLFRKKRNK